MTSPSPSLLGVPPEILDEVIDAIDSPAALLSLSCSTKDLARLIIPNHLSFRIVRAPFSGENAIWEYFAHEALHAVKVRILFVLQEGLPPLTPIEGYNVSRRIPSLPDSVIHPSSTRSDMESDLKQEELIISVVRNMKCLREFAWHRETPPSLRGRHDLWSTLKELGTVRRLDVLDCPETGDGGILHSPSFLDISGLKEFKMFSKALDTVNPVPEEPNLDPLMHMLVNNCPELELLSLSIQAYRYIGVANVTHSLPSSSWPNLHTLHLINGIGCSAACMASFLKAHQGLEELVLEQRLPRYYGRDLTSLLQSDDDGRVLPRLKRLSCSSAHAAAILPHVKDSLEFLSGIEVNETIIPNAVFEFDYDWEPEHEDDDYYETWDDAIPSPWRTALLDALSDCRSLESISVTHHPHIEDLFLLASAVPWIRRFDYPDFTYLATDTNVERWCSLYSKFPELTTLDARGLVHFADLEHVYANNNAILQKLSRAIKKILVVISWDMKAVIIRGTEEEGVKWVVRKLNDTNDCSLKEGEIVYGP